MGNSFISGEGGGAIGRHESSRCRPGFPGWSAANSNPYFCHRSANASIQVAALPGISQRVNLACSGAQPADMASPSSARPAGRTVAAQIEQLRAIARTGDIDLVLLGLGSNNSQFTFGGVAAECAGRLVGEELAGQTQAGEWSPLTSRRVSGVRPALWKKEIETIGAVGGKLRELKRKIGSRQPDDESNAIKATRSATNNDFG